jgi:predicted component of type VI protein secretion system
MEGKPDPGAGALNGVLVGRYGRRPRTFGKDTPGVNVTLVLVQEDGAKKPVPMRKSRLVVGRKPECAIRIPVASVSREHCEIVQEGDALVVRDLGSSNGTYVNRERVQEAQLKAGDILAVGPAVFVAVFDGQPAEIDAKQAYLSGKAPEPAAAAAAAPAARPAMPRQGTKPTTRPAGKPVGKPVSEDDFDIDSDDSSISDFNFDFLDEDEEDQKKL